MWGGRAANLGAVVCVQVPGCCSAWSPSIPKASGGRAFVSSKGERNPHRKQKIKKNASMGGRLCLCLSVGFFSPFFGRCPRPISGFHDQHNSTLLVLFALASQRTTLPPIHFTHARTGRRSNQPISQCNSIHNSIQSTTPRPPPKQPPLPSPLKEQSNPAPYHPQQKPSGAAP